MEELIYFNGEIKQISEVRIEIDDRGYNFADGVYEVIAIYNGVPFKLEEHLVRLQNSARELEIHFTDYHQLMEDIPKFMEQVAVPEARIYIQITRGTEPRSHLYSDDLSPNIFMNIRKRSRYPESYYTSGVSAITIPDERWPRCYIKSISLLPNILGKKKAKRAGAFEGIQIRDGYVTEGTSTNVFIVKEGIICTPPASNYILNGITRQLLLDECPKLGFIVTEKSISLWDLLDADEVFLVGTTTEVMPIIEIDGKVIGNGEVGPYTQKVLNYYRSLLP